MDSDSQSLTGEATAKRLQTLFDDKRVLLRLLEEQFQETAKWKERCRQMEDAHRMVRHRLDEQERKANIEPPDLRRYALTQRPIYCLSCTHSREPGCICPKYQVGPTQVGG